MDMVKPWFITLEEPFPLLYGPLLTCFAPLSQATRLKFVIKDLWVETWLWKESWRVYLLVVFIEATHADVGWNWLLSIVIFFSSLFLDSIHWFLSHSSWVCCLRAYSNNRRSPSCSESHGPQSILGIFACYKCLLKISHFCGSLWCFSRNQINL